MWGKEGERPRLWAPLAAVALLLSASACGETGTGDVADTAGAANTGPTLQVLAQPGEGCGRQASTDPADLAPDRAVARCAAGHPLAQPLAQRQQVVVGLRARGDDVAAILLADEHGEPEAENLDVEIVEIDDPVELYQALADGTVDVVAGDLDAPFFDQVASGADIRVVMGGPVARDAGNLQVAQAGWWVRDDAVSQPEHWIDMDSHPVALPDGIVDAAVLPVDQLLSQGGMSVNDVELWQFSGAEALAQLRDNRLKAAWLDDATARQVDPAWGISLQATRPVAESLGGVAFAGRLLDPARDRAVGLAFTRAVVRTINTYLTGDGQEAGEGLVYDWELRQGTMRRLQLAYISLGAVRFENELPESQLVDRSLYGEVVLAHDQG